MSWEWPVALGIGYALGCINFAYYGVRCFAGQDIRTLGSGNAGARNTGRVYGALAFLLVTIGDMGKAAGAVLIARALGAGVTAEGFAIVACIAGHCWPVQMGFRGGMGVNAIGGGTLVYAPWVVAWYAAVTVAGPCLGRRLVISSVVAFATCPIATWTLGYHDQFPGVTAACLLCIYTGWSDVAAAWRNRHGAEGGGPAS